MLQNIKERYIKGLIPFNEDQSPNQAIHFIQSQYSIISRAGFVENLFTFLVFGTSKLHVKSSAMRSSFVQLVALVCGFWTLTNGSPVSTPQGDEGKGPSKSDGPLQKDIVVLSPKVIPALNKEICWKPVVFESDKKVGTGSNKAPTADKNKGQSINKKNPKALPRGHRTGNRDRVQPDPPHGRVYSGEWLSEAFFQPDQGHPFTFIDYNEQPYIAASHVGQESQDLLRDQYPSLVTSREYIQPGGNNRLNREQSGFTNHPTRHRLQHELQISPPSGMSQEDFERRAEIEEWPPASAPQGGRGALLSYVPSEDQGSKHFILTC